MYTIVHLLETYKYLILLPLTIIEGPIVTITASFLASLGYLNVFIVYGISVLGDVIADSLLYLLGRIGRHTIIPRYGRFVGITEERLHFAEEHYKKHLMKTIFFGKVTNVPNITILITAGASRVNFKKYFLIVFIAEILKQPILVFIGYYFGKSYISIEKVLGSIYKALAIIFIAAIFLYIVYRIIMRRIQK